MGQQFRAPQTDPQSREAADQGAGSDSHAAPHDEAHFEGGPARAALVLRHSVSHWYWHFICLLRFWKKKVVAFLAMHRQII